MPCPEMIRQLCSPLSWIINGGNRTVICCREPNLRFHIGSTARRWSGHADCGKSHGSSNSPGLETDAVHLGLFIREGRIASKDGVSAIFKAIYLGLDVLLPFFTELRRHTLGGFHAAQRAHTGGEVGHGTNISTGIFRPELRCHALSGYNEMVRSSLISFRAILENQTSREAITVRHDGFYFCAAIAIAGSIAVGRSIPYLDVAQGLLGHGSVSQGSQQIRFLQE
mmetsp:Transcript_4577/g.11001  ORF Transcript_4577/g.11001 Transcript_4577/m.11001 type:complete len:225 (-) Transcript_4577:580-1254(-)